uniref:Uncharacterized protein n=1 Tax=Heterorhabditis bacteriophora TaxID=37862 RepID=A0A1I7XN65_HETBA
MKHKQERPNTQDRELIRDVPQACGGLSVRQSPLTPKVPLLSNGHLSCYPSNYLLILLIMTAGKFVPGTAFTTTIIHYLNHVVN